MQQPDEGAAEKEIEAAESHERSWIVEHASRGVFQKAALLEETAFQQVAQALASFQFLKYLFQWFTPFQRSAIGFHENRLQDPRHIREG